MAECGDGFAGRCEVVEPRRGDPLRLAFCRALGRRKLIKTKKGAPGEPGLRRMVPHCAHLCAVAGGVCSTAASRALSTRGLAAPALPARSRAAGCAPIAPDKGGKRLNNSRPVSGSADVNATRRSSRQVRR